MSALAISSCSYPNEYQESTETTTTEPSVAEIIIEKPKSPVICYDIGTTDDKKYPIHEAALKWSQKGIVEIRQYSMDCKEFIFLHVVEMKDNCGEHQRYARNTHRVTLAKTCYAAWSSVVAHEFGHVLGLGHNNAKHSVMNTNNAALWPTDRDLKEVAKIWK